MKNTIKTIQCEGYTWELMPVSKEELLEQGFPLKIVNNRQVRYLGKCIETGHVCELSYFYRSDIGDLMTVYCF